jgi:hypothetical protein
MKTIDFGILFGENTTRLESAGEEYVGIVSKQTKIL